MDYYRGKVKSVYEKEPAFKDFYRNIPLSETNFYDNHNLTRIKHRFNNLVQNKMGRDQMNSRYDPYTPSGVRIINIVDIKQSNRIYFKRLSGIFEPASGKLALKHKAVPRTPAPLPLIHIYHRNSRR